MNKNNILYWTPRIIIILLICLIGLISLDVFGMSGSLLAKLGGFFMHNIPTFTLIFLLVFTWKKEKIGGIIFIILGAIFTIFFSTYRRIDIFLLISLPPLLSGLLFLLHDRLIKKALNNSK
ncbi:MAG: hypothetical protein NTZ84_02825 [Candidatus Nealsonbacteria bacterium]|nr:hypothetical protein [Candidatus Nealsonbacteria bacterium]